MKHTRETCFKLIGYLVGWKPRLKGKNPPPSYADQSSILEHGQEDMQHDDVDRTLMNKVVQEDYYRFMKGKDVVESLVHHISDFIAFARFSGKAPNAKHT